MRGILLVIANLFLLGCGETYHGTKDICEGKFYLEFYSEWSDMGACYLTDSINFRVKVYRYNIESEYSKYNCTTDSLTIELWSNYPLPKHILTTKTFNVKKLIAEGKLDN
jgi:hypothetical protein